MKAQEKALDMAHATRVRKARQQGDDDLIKTIGSKEVMIASVVPPAIKKRKKKKDETKVTVTPIGVPEPPVTVEKVILSNQVKQHHPNELAQYALKNDERSYMDRLFKQSEHVKRSQGQEELFLIGALPDQQKYNSYLDKLKKEQAQGYFHTVNHVIMEKELELPDTDFITRQYLEIMLQEYQPGRDRPCKNGQSCLCLKEKGFIMREMIPTQEYLAWKHAMKVSPSTAYQELRFHYPCAWCDLAFYKKRYIDLNRKYAYREPQMNDDGKVHNSVDEWGIFHRWSVRVSIPGEFDAAQCIGASEKNYVGLHGHLPFVESSKWAVDHYIIETDTGSKTMKKLLIPSYLLFKDGVKPGRRGDKVPSSPSLHMN